MIKLKNFGAKLTPNSLNFEWPTRDVVERLSLDSPPKLSAIRTKRHQNGKLTAISMVFDGGLNSPWFDANHASASDQISTIQLGGRSISKVTIHTNNDSTYKLKFEHEGGIQSIYDKGSNNSSSRVQEIPQDHFIVGIYGRIAGKELNCLSFILREE